MTHLPAARWGRAWLEHGAAECRLLKPVYDGDTGDGDAPAKPRTGSSCKLDSHGELCATGRASLTGQASPAPPIFAEAPAPPSPPEDRPPADETTLAVGTWFAIHPFRVDPDGRPAISCRRAREPAALCRRRAGASRDHPAHRQLGVAPQCRLGAVDACRQPDRAFRRGQDRRRAFGQGSRHRQLRARRATASSISTCWSMPTARRRSPASPISRSTARASSPPLEIDGELRIRRSGRRWRGGRDLAGLDLVRWGAEAQTDAVFLPVAPIGDRIGQRDRGGRNNRQQCRLGPRRAADHARRERVRADAADPELAAGIGAGRGLLGEILGRRRICRDRGGEGGMAVGGDQLGLAQRQAIGRVDRDDVGDAARGKAGADLLRPAATPDPRRRKRRAGELSQGTRRGA